MFHYTRVEHIESKARPGSASDAGLDEERHSDPEEPAASSSPSKTATADMITSKTALASIFPLHVVCGALTSTVSRNHSCASEIPYL